MAGFDFEFTYSEPQQSIVEICLPACRARARQLNLRWSWRTLGPRRLRVRIDGNSRTIDLLGYRLERDLPLIAEGCDTTHMSRPSRQRVGRGFADLMLRGRHLEQDGSMVLQGVSETRWHYPPYDLECPAYPRVNARLSTTVEVIVGWNFDEVEPDVFLEEVHTACELVLEEAAPRRSKKKAFAELITAAEAQGALGFGDDKSRAVRLLTELKDLRKNVRHRAADGAGGWLHENLLELMMILERLVGRLNSCS